MGVAMGVANGAEKTKADDTPAALLRNVPAQYSGASFWSSFLEQFSGACGGDTIAGTFRKL